MDFSQAVQYKKWPLLCKCSFGYSETYFIALQVLDDVLLALLVIYT